MNSNCSIGTVIRQMPDRTTSHGYVRLDCKRLSCVRCGPKRARRYQRAIAQQAEKLGLKRFVTLTIDPARLSQEDSSDYIRKCWNNFRTYLRRRFGQKVVQYIAVLEHQKSG